MSKTFTEERELRTLLSRSLILFYLTRTKKFVEYSYVFYCVKYIINNYTMDKCPDYYDYKKLIANIYNGDTGKVMAKYIEINQDINIKKHTLLSIKFIIDNYFVESNRDNPDFYDTLYKIRAAVWLYSQTSHGFTLFYLNNHFLYNSLKIIIDEYVNGSDAAVKHNKPRMELFDKTKKSLMFIDKTNLRKQHLDLEDLEVLENIYNKKTKNKHSNDK